MVVAKDVGHKIGDLVVYFEIDSFLPIRPEYEFLRKTSFKRMGDQEGFRLKTIRMRGQFSQGLILPIKVLNGTDEYKLGDDVAEILGIVKYEPPIPAQLEGVMKGNFPSFIRKTDEERIQNLTDEYEEYKKMDTKWYVTEKLDGSSTSYYLNEDEFGTCSRNIELQPSETNSFWKAARDLKIESIMKDWSKGRFGFFGNHSIQGELIGEGIQGNPYKLKGQTVRFFNLFDIKEQQWIDFDQFETWMNLSELKTVPILDRDFKLPDTIEELIEYADGMSVLNKQTRREGIVIRSHDRKISFKVISNKFLLNKK